MMTRGPGRGALLLVSVAQFLVALDYSIVYLALPGIAASLRLSPAAAQWVVSGYAVPFAGFLIVGGRLTDRFGPVRMFIVAVTVFGLASGAGAAAGNGAALVAARAVQGLGAALLQPAVLGLIGTRFPAGRARARALAVWAAVGAAGLSAGVLLGGLLAAASWRLVLLVNLPPALLCALAAARDQRTAPLLPEKPTPVQPNGGGEDRRTAPVPLLGAAFGTGAVLALTVFLTIGGDQGWAGPAALGCLLLAVVLGGLFARHEATSGAALIDPALRDNPAVRAGAAAAALYMASVGSEFYVLTLLLQSVRHYSPLGAGLAFLPLAASVTVGSATAARAERKASPPVVLAAGFLIALAGLLWIVAGLRGDAYLAGLLPGLLLSGFGHGAVYTAMFLVGTGDVPADRQGTAGALLTTAQYLSGAVSLAGLTLLLGPHPGDRGLTAAFAFLAAAAAAGAVLAAALSRPRGRAPAR